LDGTQPYAAEHGSGLTAVLPSPIPAALLRSEPGPTGLRTVHSDLTTVASGPPGVGGESEVDQFGHAGRGGGEADSVVRVANPPGDAK
jgi:hypothetical protein